MYVTIFRENYQAVTTSHTFKLTFQQTVAIVWVLCGIGDAIMDCIVVVIKLYRKGAEVPAVCHTYSRLLNHLQDTS